MGTKKTAFANFSEIAKMLHRQPKHLLAFLFAELGTRNKHLNNMIIIGWEAFKTCPFFLTHVSNCLSERD